MASMQVLVAERGSKMKCGKEIEQNASSPDMGPKDTMPPAAHDFHRQLKAGRWLRQSTGIPAFGNSRLIRDLRGLVTRALLQGHKLAAFYGNIRAVV